MYYPNVWASGKQDITCYDRRHVAAMLVTLASGAEPQQSLAPTPAGVL